jgi:hypothetical protein
LAAVRKYDWSPSGEPMRSELVPKNSAGRRSVSVSKNQLTSGPISSAAGLISRPI